MSLTLPTSKIPASTTNPQFLVLIGREKVGKTSALAQLDNNLIIDLEGGSTFVDAMAIQCRTISDLGEAASAIRAKNKEVGHNFYKHITIDNATSLEEICLGYAATLYRQQPMGKNWTGTDVRTLPQGSGYYYLRTAVLKVIDMFKELCDEFILVGHIKDTIVDDPATGEELTERSLDLVGKLSGMVCRRCDGVGYMYRSGNEVHIKFKADKNIAMGCRSEHLKNKDIVISEMDDETGVLTTHWDRIYK
nr:MAG TPA: AAA domain protein [Bacteriophage sp.]DAR41807.1 MAG TPA: AAA domain protein [Bacteriophage sp.]